MADDTRKVKIASTETPQEIDVPKPRRPKPKHDFPQTQAGKLWQAFGNPEDPVNAIPGGTFNSAGGRPKEVTWRDAFNFSIFKKDGPSWYQAPCARDSLLVGIGTGSAVGGVRFILTGLSSMLATANYAVGGFCLTACGMYYWCQQRRMEEARGMAAAVAGMKVLNERKARERATEAAAKAVAEKQAEETKVQNKRWYKFW